MHVLKPEAINITRKNIQNVFTNIKNIYINLYIYIYKIHSKRMGRQLCTNKAPVVTERTNQQKTSGKRKAREMQETMKTKEK